TPLLSWASSRSRRYDAASQNGYGSKYAGFNTPKVSLAGKLGLRRAVLLQQSHRSSLCKYGDSDSVTGKQLLTARQCQCRFKDFRTGMWQREPNVRSNGVQWV
ncbi:MAG: hypothetical protein ACI84R_003488, partial [Candidatus Azotimanducaceae bacterium]